MTDDPKGLKEQRFRFASFFGEPEFTRLCRLACAVLDTPIALLYLFEDGSPICRAAWGISGEDAEHAGEFAEHVRRRQQMFVTNDALEAAAVQEYPAVGKLGVRFLAGTPITLPGRGVAAVLSVMSDAPRPEGLTEQQEVAFGVLAESAAHTLDGYIKDQIRELQARFEVLTDAASKVFYDWELSSDTIQWRQGSESGLLQSVEKIGRGRKWWWEHIHPEDREWVMSSLNDAITGDLGYWSAEYRFCLGSTVFEDVLVRGYIERDAAGVATRITGSVLNLSQQRTRQREVELLADQLTTVLDSTTDAVIMMGSDWRVRYVNQNAYRMVGEGMDLVGRNLLEVFQSPAAKPFIDCYQRAMLTQTPTTFEGFYSPLQRWFEVHVYPTPENLTLFFKDVSERHIAQAALVEAHDRLRASSEKMQRMLNQSQDMFCILDSVGRVVEVSSAARTVLGFEPEELLGTPISEWIDPQDRETCLAAIENCRDGKPVRGLQSRFRKRNGTVVHVSWSAAWSATDQATFFVGRDISESVEAVHRLRESEASLQRAQEIAHLGSWSFDRSTGIGHWTPEVFKILGRSCNEISPGWESYLQCVHPEDQKRVADLAAEKTFWAESEHRIIRPDKSIRFVHLRVEPRLGGRESMEWLGILQDVTTRRQLEDELRAGEQRYRLLFERNPHPMYVFELETLRILAVNEAAIQLYQYSEAEFLQMTLRDLRSPSDVPALEASVRSLSEGPAESGIWKHVTQDGRELLMDIRSHTISFAGKNARLVLAWDVTEKLALEDRLRQSQKMEAVGQLAGGIAHDFNNLLTVINGYADVLREQIGNDPKARRAADLILESGNRAAKLTRQLLAFSRKQVLQPVLLDLNVAISQVIPMLRSLIPEDIRIQIELSAEPAMVMADWVQMEQVLMNLAINARDAMGGGGVLKIETENIFLEKEKGEYVLLSVTDNGTGMTAEVRSRIFEPFFTTKERGAGTGLGLSTVHGIVQQSGGFIHVFSEPGAVTNFRIYLPRSV